MKKGIFKEDIKSYAPDSYSDYRGDLYTTWNEKDFKKIFESEVVFNHDKVSSSRKNVLRGIHGDFKSTKLMTCVYGEIYYVVVDNRKNSKTYLQWDWDILSGKNKKMLLIPPGFGSSFLVLSDEMVVHYKWSYDGDYPDVNDQFSLAWNDKKLNIHWPINNPILSERDKNARRL
jgi:dTDP-4-dehydrorhamnose 3,5-epimerase